MAARLRISFLVFAAAVALAAQPVLGADAPAQLGDADMLTLPNLAPLAPYDVFIGRAEQPQGPVWSRLESDDDADPAVAPALRFTTTIRNLGRYGLELWGAPWQPDPAEPDLLTSVAYQCVRFTGQLIMGAQRNCVRLDRVGALTWHAEHRHMHINGFGRYELRRDRSGKPDMTPAGLLGRAQKVGWCVSDMENWRVDSSGPSYPGQMQDNMTPGAYQRAWYKECTDPILYSGASWRQGISPGWADTYPALYTGQEIPLKGVGDGVYWIVTTINPKDNEFGLTIKETTWADNASASRVQIYAGGKKARLLGPMPPQPFADYFPNPESQPGN